MRQERIQPHLELVVTLAEGRSIHSEDYLGGRLGEIAFFAVESHGLSRRHPDSKEPEHTAARVLMRRLVRSSQLVRGLRATVRLRRRPVFGWFLRVAFWMLRRRSRRSRRRLSERFSCQVLALARRNTPP